MTELAVTQATASETASETVAVTADNAASEGDSMQTGTALAAGLIAMVLIYLVTRFLPKIAAAVDRAWDKISGSGKKSSSQADSAGAENNNYRVYDIYEGEMNLDNYKADDKKENPNGKG